MRVQIPGRADMLQKLRSVSTESWRMQFLFPLLQAEAGKTKDILSLYTLLAASFRVAARGNERRAQELYADMELYIRALVDDPQKQARLIAFMHKARPVTIAL